MAAAALLLLAATPTFGQTLTIKGADGQSRVLTPQDLKSLPHETVTASEHGHTATYSGVAVTALTALVGAPHGEALRGHAMTDVLVVTASVGYRVALSLAEIDPSMRADRVIVADAADGKPLGPHDGPLRLIVEGDKRPARSARGIQSIEVRAPP